MDTSKTTKRAAESARFQRAVTLLSNRDTKKLEQAMNKLLDEGKREQTAFDLAWDEVIGF